ncbi:MAG: hypothetical protein Q8K45_00690 [Rubrivivax sp.]|nr:hypothetical protein [Rubrivivax sp.]
MAWFDLLLAAPALALALALRPWRATADGLPAWPALAFSAALPMLWGADHLSAVSVLQPLSGACLLMLMLGWPLTVLLLVPVAIALALVADLSLLQTLHRAVWLGLVPATLAMGLGAALRRWLPHHLFVYILGRGFFATCIAGIAAGLLATWLEGVPPSGLAVSDLVVGRSLAAWGDAFLTGGLVAIFVAFKPNWLATYADRIYLPSKPPG